MIPYNDFQLNEQQLKEFKESNAKRLISKYIEKHGVEPSSIVEFYNITNEQYERQRRRLYACLMAQNHDDDEPSSGDDGHELPIGYVKVPNNEVWYKSTQNELIEPKYLTSDAWGANLVSNTYEDGFGKMKFDGDVLKMKMGTLPDCDNLIEIYFPDTIIEIENHAISCASAYGGGGSLSKVQLGKNLTNFSGGSIWVMTNNLASIDIHPDNQVFYSQNNCVIETASGTLIKGCVTSVIPDNVTAIGGGAFWGAKMQSIVLPELITVIGGEAFSHSSISSINIPSSLQRIEDGAFEETNITSITLTNCVKQIGSWGFHGSKLSWANIDVESIGNGAFGNCTLLTAVTFGKSVKQIGDNLLGSQHKVFAGCINLININYLGTIDEWNNISFGDLWYSDDVPAEYVHCSDGDIELRPTEQIPPSSFTMTIMGDTDWQWSGQILNNSVYSGDWVIAGDWSMNGEWTGGSTVEQPATEAVTVKSMSGFWQRVNGTKILTSQPTATIYVNNVGKASLTPNSYGSTYALFGNNLSSQITINPGDHVIVEITQPS